MASPSIHAMAEGASAATEFPSTTAGLQAAIDSLAGAKGKVFIGPGTLEHTTCISIHSNCHLQGSGVGVTILQRASGSLTAADAARSGVSLLVTPYGTNGTRPTGTGDAQSNITISDMTIDANSSAFAIDPSTPWHYAIYAAWTDGLRITNVEAKNTLQTGIGTDACKNVLLSDVRIKSAGQYASPSSKNSLDFNNTFAAADAAGYNVGYTVTNLLSDSPGDEHIMCHAVNDVAVSNAVCIGGEIVIELQGSTTYCTTMKRFTFTNIVSDGNIEAFFQNGLSTGVTLAQVAISNCTMVASASAHVTAGLNISQAGNGQIVTDFTISDSVFYNINSSDTSGLDFVSIRGNSATNSERISITNCKFFGGAPSSTRTSNHGLNVASNVAGLAVKDCTFVNVPGVGVFIHPGTDQAVRDVDLSHLFLDTINNDGYQIVENSSTNGSIKYVSIVGCSTRNACRQTGSNGFRIGAVSAAGGGVVSNVVVEGCRVYLTSGSNPAIGLDINQGAGGTTTKVSASNNDFDVTTPYKSNTGAGSPTALHIVFPQGVGSAIGSAATLAMKTDGSVYHVTGSTNITNGFTVLPHDNGRRVTLIFDSTPTVSDTGTSVLNGDFIATANDTLTVVCDGTNWYEVARSAN